MKRSSPIATSIDCYPSNVKGVKMRDLVSIAILCVLLLVVGCADDSGQPDVIKLSFRLHSESLPENATVYIAGAGPALGNWKPDEKRMTYAGDHEWTFQLLLRKPQSLEYKYTLGTWAIEGADATGQPLPNLSHDVRDSTEIRDHIDFWTKPGAREVQGQITGTVKYHRQLSGENIRERDTLVWLPPDYETSTERYAVLYMHDGQNIVDPKTSTFGVDWQIDETCSRLIEEQAIAPLIVVGIYNTPDRSEEYLPGVKCDAYMDFVANRLKPFIDEQYRTQPSRDHTLVGGSSAGGLCAFMLVWEHSQVFSKALCMSSSFKYVNDEGEVSVDFVSEVENSDRPTEPVSIYIDNGGIGLEQRLQPGIEGMLNALRAQGFVFEKDLWWVHATDALHSESAWAKRFPAAIQILTDRTSDRRGDPAIGLPQ